MDDAQLRRVLGVRRDQRRGVGARVEHACNWALVLRSILLDVIIYLLLPLLLSYSHTHATRIPTDVFLCIQAPSPPRHRRRAHYHLDRHGAQRDDRRAAARQLPCPEPLLFRVLVQLLLRHLPRRVIHVLVWDPDVHRLRVRVPDAQGDLAVSRTSA